MLRQLRICPSTRLIPLRSNLEIQQCFYSANRSPIRHTFVVAGGGTGGCAVANSLAGAFARHPNSLAVIEPSDLHYYQAGFTLVGAGVKDVEWTKMPTSSCISATAVRYKNKVVEFMPQENKVRLDDGNVIVYDYLLVALGLQLRFDLVEGLTEALEESDNVSTNYTPHYAPKTYRMLQQFSKSGGNALFTFPHTPIKCAGAPQKIMYLADDYLRKNSARDKAHITYATPGPAIFGVPHYAKALDKIAAEREIQVNKLTTLKSVDGRRSEATFDVREKPDGEVVDQKVEKFDMMHVGPPCGPPPVLAECKAPNFTDAAGWLSIHPHTLQHMHYHNVFGIGDCTNLPTSRTAAAVAGQTEVVVKNMKRYFRLKDRNVSLADTGAPAAYDGYASCPMITSYNTCMLMEFGYNNVLLETFPIAQNKPRVPFYYMKRDVIPYLYWKYLIRGRWHGPRAARKLLHLGFGN